MHVFGGDKNGKSFGYTTISFAVPLNKHGLWNSLCLLEDDTIIALTSTNAYKDNSTEVWMIKGGVINN